MCGVGWTDERVDRGNIDEQNMCGRKVDCGSFYQQRNNQNDSLAMVEINGNPFFQSLGREPVSSGIYGSGG